MASTHYQFGPIKRPDVEFKREISPGTFRVYGHIYWRPLIVHLLGRTLIGRKHCIDPADYLRACERYQEEIERLKGVSA